VHSHDYIEIAFVQSGCGWHMLDDELSRCEPGSLYVIDYDIPHLFVSEHNCTLTIYSLIFRPEFFEIFPSQGKSISSIIQHFLLKTFRYGDFAHSLSATFDDTQQTYICSLFERMLEEYAVRKAGFEELIRVWTVELLVYIFRKLCTDSEYMGAPAHLKTDMLQEVFAYIQQNYTSPITLDELAMLAFVSPKYFSRLFKAHTGCTVTEYTQKLRIRHSLDLLSRSDLPIAEIADQVGYHDVKSFQKVFRKLLGISPAEYGKQALIS